MTQFLLLRLQPKAFRSLLLGAILNLAPIFVAPNSGFAIEESSILKQYSVVGVIAGLQNSKDVAVIRDVKNHKSITIQVGSFLGSKKDYQVIEIARRSVIIEKDKQRFSLQYGVPEKANKSADSQKENDGESQSLVEAKVQEYLDNDDNNYNDDSSEESIYQELSRLAELTGNGLVNDINTYQILQERRKQKRLQPYIYQGNDEDETYSEEEYEDNQYTNQQRRQMEIEEEARFRKKYMSTNLLIQPYDIADEEASDFDENPSENYDDEDLLD